MNRSHCIAAFAAAITLALSACGGESKPTTAPDIVAKSPKSSAQIVAPASEASAPIAASAPAPEPAPVPAASAPAASEPVASAPVPASTPAIASTPVVQIAIYGDDQTSGIATNNLGLLQVVAPNEPTQLQGLLQSAFNDAGITVQSLSTGGVSSSLQNELDGMDGLGNGQPQRMQASGASIVIEAHVLNDALGGETVAEYAAYLGQWIQDAQAAGLQPVLEEPGPVCDGNHPQLGAYVEAIDTAAARYNVPLIKQYGWISSMQGWQIHMVGCLVPDAYLDGLKAQAEQAVIAPLVKAQIGG